MSDDLLPPIPGTPLYVTLLAELCSHLKLPSMWVSPTGELLLQSIDAWPLQDHTRALYRRLLDLVGERTRVNGENAPTALALQALHLLVLLLEIGASSLVFGVFPCFLSFFSASLVCHCFTNLHFGSYCAWMGCFQPTTTDPRVHMPAFLASPHAAAAARQSLPLPSFSMSSPATPPSSMKNIRHASMATATSSSSSHSSLPESSTSLLTSSGSESPDDSSSSSPLERHLPPPTTSSIAHCVSLLKGADLVQLELEDFLLPHQTLFAKDLGMRFIHSVLILSPHVTIQSFETYFMPWANKSRTRLVCLIKLAENLRSRPANVVSVNSILSTSTSCSSSSSSSSSF